MHDTALETLAANVRRARTAAGLSLDALAARADVSKGALVAVEAGGGNPTFSTLVRLADALGRPVTALIGEAREEPVTVVDAGDVEPLWTGPAGGTARLLLTNARPSPVEVWRWRLHPGERHESHPHQPGVTETLTVVTGRLLLVVGGAEHRLAAGATATYAADVPHAYAGAGRGACEAIMTVHLPEGALR